MLKRLSALLSIFFLFATAFAEEFHIQSDKLNAEKDKVVYVGHVIVTTETGKRLKCDKLVVFLDKNGKVEKIMAVGHVLYTDKKLKAMGNIALYYPKTKVIVLEGNAVIVSNRGVIKGERIVYNLQTGAVDVKSHRRVQSVIDIDRPSNGK